MFDFRKEFIFLAIAIFFVYNIRFKVITKELFDFKWQRFFLIIIGLALIAVASFLDAFSDVLNNYYVHKIIEFCFTSGAIIYIVGIIIICDYVKKRVAYFHKSSLIDHMTGIYNRAGLENIYDKKIKSGKQFYVIMCDLDGMKRINDELGHLLGDKYVLDSVKIIKEYFGKDAYIARTGGDEFVIILENMHESELHNIILKVKKSVSEIFLNKNVGISVGYSLYGADGQDLQELIGVADQNMYIEKNEKRSKVK